MGAALDIIVCELQQCWKIVFPSFLMTPSQTTIEMAAMLAMIAYKTGNMHHSRTVCSEQCKEDPRLKFMLESTIPDS
jgi:predicted secreted protein